MSMKIPRWMTHLTAGVILASTVPAGATLSGSSSNDLPDFTGSANLPPSADAIIRNADEPIRIALQPASAVNSARVTFYDPNQNNALEGGGNNRYSERINSIEDAIQNGRPVSIAADVYGKFGKACNRSSSRCLILVTAEGFDRLYPQYRQRFPNLPANSFIGIIEDTGSAFFGKGTKRLDLAARSSRLARAIPPGFNDRVRWVQMQNPCGAGHAGRMCDFGQTTVAPTALAMLDMR